MEAPAGETPPLARLEQQRGELADRRDAVRTSIERVERRLDVVQTDLRSVGRSRRGSLLRLRDVLKSRRHRLESIERRLAQAIFDLEERLQGAGDG
ncbi:MAG: hypothetical protein M3134_00875 [Actinomycetota bacterium]|nr:hypothetical protein [Actinomycetota bacterium]